VVERCRPHNDEDPEKAQAQERAANPLDRPPEQDRKTGRADDATDADPETERFSALHEALHIAVQAVIDLSDGEIVYLE
jgi:hypothetical protein